MQLLDAIQVCLVNVIDFNAPKFVISERLPGQRDEVRFHVLLDNDLKSLETSGYYLSVNVFEFGEADNVLEPLTTN